MLRPIRPLHRPLWPRAWRRRSPLHAYLPPVFKVLHSSAGAGKTHALVKHYLTRCLTSGDPAAYRHVLALTFTSKAAGEMQERVIQYLERIAAGERGSATIDDVVAELVRATQRTPEGVAAQARAVLGHMLHHWSDVAISTIDAFTRRVVRPFARDLQLDHELRMTTDEQHYRDRAVDALVSEAGVDTNVTELLTEACLQLLHEERKWDPEGPLRELSVELTKEGSIVPLERLRHVPAGQVAPLATSLREAITRFTRQVQALGREALEMIARAGIAPEDMAHGRSGIHGYFRKLAAFEGPWAPPGAHALKALDTGKWHGGKASKAAQAAIEGLVPQLTRIFQEAESLRESGHRDHLVQRAVLSELPTAFALHELDGRLADIKREDGITFFSDLTRKVAAVVKDEPVPFIHERMGERYRHFLIDEFQDTSLLQWNALMPLIENALASGGSALLGGDAKQALYRWRNGEVRLFTGFPHVFGRDPDDPVEAQREATLVRNYDKPEALAHNYRSSGTIIHFNNTLFARMGQLLPEVLRDVYAGHEQGVVRQEEGLVVLETLPAELKGEERLEAMLAFTLRQVQEALADGFMPGDIAVLVRAKGMGRDVAMHLVANGINVVSPDGLRLSGDPVIELVIDLLRFIHHDDVTAAARVVQYQAMLNAAQDHEPVRPFDEEAELPDPVAMVRAHLAAHGAPTLRTTLTALVADLAKAWGLQPGSDAQLLTLLDEVHAWTTEHGQNIGGFLEHYERRGGERGVVPPDNGLAVQVMTVHASKGLQFPVVIMPTTRMAAGSHIRERFWIAPGAAVPELPVSLVRESSALREAGLPVLLEEEGLRLLDDLNLLYVAFTRPEQRLLALVPASRPDTVSKALLAYMAEQAPGDDRLVLGNRHAPWSRRKSVTQEHLADVSGEHGHRPVVAAEAPVDWDPLDPDPYRAFGNAVHEVLAHMHKADDLGPALQCAVDDGLLDAAAANQLQGKLAPLLAAPALANWFGEGLQVRTEATLILADGRTLRPDRVVTDGGRTGVLDIKTGVPREEHGEQVRTYMSALRDLGHAQVDGALLYVREGRLEPIDP